MTTSQHPTVRHLARAEGRLAYTDQGSGPLVVAAPGMGDLRATYDDVVPHLLAAGHRVVVIDLRGHGDSDTTFATHGDEATASDYVALVEHLDAGPAVLLGSSMAATAAVVAAAEAARRRVSERDHSLHPRGGGLTFPARSRTLVCWLSLP